MRIILAILIVFSIVVLSVQAVQAEGFVFTGQDTVLLCSEAVLYLPYQANHDIITFVIGNNYYRAVMADNPSEYSHSFSTPLEGTASFSAIIIDGEYFAIQNEDVVTCEGTDLKPNKPQVKIYLPRIGK